MGLCVFFTLTDPASTIPVIHSIRGCQSATWSAGQEKIRETIYKCSNESIKNKNKAKNDKVNQENKIKADTRKDTDNSTRGDTVL